MLKASTNLGEEFLPLVSQPRIRVNDIVFGPLRLAAERSTVVFKKCNKWGGIVRVKIAINVLAQG